MKKIVMILVFMTVFLFTCSSAVCDNNYPNNTNDLYIEFNELEEIEVITYNTEEVVVKIFDDIDVSFTYTEDKYEIENNIELCNNYMNSAHQIADAARIFGCDDDSILIKECKDIWQKCFDIRSQYEKLYDELFDSYNKQLEEYPYATYVWYFLKDNGFNNYVAAGILGNMMCECGGFTLNLQPEIISYDNYYYGLCQWNKTYYREVWYQDIEFQCEFLLKTIQEEIDMFGICYSRNFKYKDFMNLQNEQDAAKAFACTYERCNSLTYRYRQDCAKTAFDYFVSGK